MSSNLDQLMLMLLCGLTAILAVCCGLCVLLIAWRGKLAGLMLSVGVVICGVAILVMTLRGLPRYWWISVPPILIGILGLRAWRMQPNAGDFRLSTLLLLVAGVAVTCGGIARLVHQQRGEEPIVAQLESLIHGDVERDFDGIAVGVILYEVEWSTIDTILNLAGQLPHLRRLQMNHCSISEDQARRIGELRNLRQLWLQSTNMDDQKVTHLSRLSKLVELDLMNTQVTGAGLGSLRSAKRLERIWLSNESVARKDLEQLQRDLPKLEVSDQAVITGAK